MNMKRKNRNMPRKFSLFICISRASEIKHSTKSPAADGSESKSGLIIK
jgi:hypothetical protein